MPTLNNIPPSFVRSDIQSLRQSLEEEIPEKSNDNFLIATWNIRSFASLTREWTATNQSPKRDLRGLLAIIEILSRFDVIAIQEVKGNLRALRDTLNFLGDSWSFLMTDVNFGRGGNNERFVFLFDRRRVRPSGLAAELVLPPERLELMEPGALNRQFVRTPYAVSFVRGNSTIILVTLHVLFGTGPELERLPELMEIANFMRDWAARSNRFHHNLLTLGDFNIDRQGSAGFDAFTSTGLQVPDVLIDLPRTIFDDPGDSDDDSYYDQIAWFMDDDRALIDLQLRRGSNFDFLPHVYTNTELTRNQISHRVSDHLPLWVEFEI